MRPWLVLVAVLEAVLIAALLLMRTTGEAPPQLAAVEAPAAAHEEAAPIAPAPRPMVPVESSARRDDEAAPAAARTAVANPEPAGAEEALGLVVFGTVHDEAGKPAKDFWISCTRGKPDEQWNAQRTPKGYVMAGLEPGRFKLKVNSDGFIELEKSIELSAGQRFTRLDLVLTSVTLVKVKVLTPEGQPFATAYKKLRDEQAQPWRAEPYAVATVEPPPKSFQNQWELSVGNWTGRDYPNQRALPNEYLGELSLQRQPPLFVSLLFANTILDTVRVEPGQQEVEFRLAPATLKGMLGSLTVRFVRDGDAQPLEGLNVSFGDGGSQGRTDRDGKVRQTDLAPGTARLMVSGNKELERWERSVVIEPGKETEVGTVRLRGPAPIRGKVLDASGKPAAAQLNLLALDPVEGDRFGSRHGGRSDAEGEFTLAQVTRGRFLLRATDQRTKETGWVAVDNSAGPVDGVRVELRPSATLTLKPKGEPRGWSYVILTGDGLVVSSSRLWNQEQPVQLPPGSYSVQLWQSKRLERTVPVTLTAAGAAIEVP
jgi:hypothetical protein